MPSVLRMISSETERFNVLPPFENALLQAYSKEGHFITYIQVSDFYETFG